LLIEVLQFKMGMNESEDTVYGKIIG
jgi:hypothetical protein